ncbi:MAG: 30S ribosomal protein S1 [Armatimonadota bacterium]
MSRDSGDAIDRILDPDTALRLIEQSKSDDQSARKAENNRTDEAAAAGGPEDEAAADARAEPTQDELEASLPEIREGEIVTGTVVDVTNEGVLVDVGTKYEGIIPSYEFPSPAELPKVNDQLSVAIVRVDDDEGQVLLSKKRADYENCWNRILNACETGEVLTAMVTERVKGGLRVDLGVHGFVPASHVGARRLRDLDRLVGRSLRLRVIEADRAQKKVILSHRVVVEEEREKRKRETLERLREGAVFEGRVRSLTNYGAFVDLGGVDGLLHISEMSWTRINHPSEVVKVGDTIQVMVLRIDRERERISLGLRQILPDPWKEAASKLRVGDIVRGRVSRVVPFGAFVQLEESGIEGIIPNAELSEKRGVEAKVVVQAGQVLDVKVLNIRLEERRMTLSLIQAQQEAERREYRRYMRGQQSQRPTIGDLAGDILAKHKANLEAAERARKTEKPAEAKDTTAGTERQAPAAEAEASPEQKAPPAEPADAPPQDAPEASEAAQTETAVQEQDSAPADAEAAEEKAEDAQPPSAETSPETPSDA